MIPVNEFRIALEKNAEVLPKGTDIVKNLIRNNPKTFAGLALLTLAAGAIGAVHVADPFLTMRRDKKKLNVMGEQKNILSELLREQKGLPEPGAQKLIIPPLS